MAGRLAVVGAGAAGLMASIHAASGGTETVLLDRKGNGGRKILISGGGRCNILPMTLDESRFVTDSSPNTLRKIVRSWPLAEQIAFFERDLSLTLAAEPETGKLFPSTNRAGDVHEGLLKLAARRGVTLIPDAHVVDLTAPKREGAPWQVHFQDGRPSLEAHAVILATGGLSVPATGSDGGGLAIARRLGHTVHTTYPALTPLLASPHPFADLAGISLPGILAHACGQEQGSALRASSRGGFLFTHRGYSGPAILDISHVAVRSLESARDARITVQWTGWSTAEIETALRPRGRKTVRSALQPVLPKRLLERLIERAGADPATSCSHLRKDQRRALIDTLTGDPLRVTGHGGYRKAEVTGGGIGLQDIDPNTMQSRRRPGLFMCGETLDAFGPIGGYNFAWAWVTGRAAGRGVLAFLKK